MDDVTPRDWRQRRASTHTTHTREVVSSDEQVRQALAALDMRLAQLIAAYKVLEAESRANADNIARLQHHLETHRHHSTLAEVAA